ncbi:transmembrane protein 220-like isoform X2 [Oncorhynchus tshawytscha]|uniref:transmembrane protein 220-like isoform X2 n=1 Tax=Oncorhynchus tshawytscha TaxID=74940 RepID=UPI000D09E02B|nr:transmembrane protein 220-like isoform X2 [Oncorhynchus tshawytscha]
MNEPSEVKCTKTNFSLIIWRVCNVFMSLFFALASYVQINDPDAVLWMVAYAIPANLCLLIAIKPHVTERITNIFQQEEGREFSGLMLILVWLLLCQHSGCSIGALRLSVAVAITIFPFVAWLYYYINKELRTSWPPHCKTAL